MTAPISTPETISLPPDRSEPLPVPPVLMVRTPPELTVVATARPAKPTSSAPPLPIVALTSLPRALATALPPETIVPLATPPDAHELHAATERAGAAGETEYDLRAAGDLRAEVGAVGADDLGAAAEHG